MSHPPISDSSNPTPPRPLGLFIVGTNTEVGKTWVTCAIARHLSAAGVRVGVYKPAASGAIRRGSELVSTDAEALWQAAGRPLTLADVCPQVFEAPLAPHLAAREEGKTLDAARLRSGFEVWNTDSWDVVLVEGAGGLMSPISEHDFVADIAIDLELPLLMVVPNLLGMIGQTLQAILAAHAYRRCLPEIFPRRPIDAADPHRRLRTAGIVLNHPSPPPSDDVSLSSNRTELETQCTIPVVGELEHQAQQFDSGLDWWAWIQHVHQI